ncbi:hypothetical protein QQX98_004690 [Neonectria punicea]|uniref:Uncharacterized protein n=1 Tax=Neonectria punicea TaxID=979145 RepID=A0ABR1H9L8_9HYPO
MTAFVPQYDGVEWIKETARHVANLAQIDRLSSSQPGQTSVTDWSQILTSRPNTYLKMTWTIDLCISKGRLPEKHDFPAWLPGQLTLSKDPNSTLLQQQDRLHSMTEPNARGGSFNCDIEQILGLVPQMTDFRPSGRLLVDQEDNTFGNDWAHGEDIGRTGWNLFGALQEQQ